MEGQERRHLEARIRVLRDIQTLLDAAVLQMNQYGVLVARLEQEGSNTTETVRNSSEDALASATVQPTAEEETVSAPASSDIDQEVLTPEEETNLSDQERLRRRRLQRFMNGAEPN